MKILVVFVCLLQLIVNGDREVRLLSKVSANVNFASSPAPIVASSPRINIKAASSATVTKVNAKIKTKHNCSNEKDFLCSVGNKCIRNYQICDGFNDCPNKSDEKNCEWCNRTFNNEFVNRVLIQNPTSIIRTSLTNVIFNCYYKIVNIKDSIITGIRMRKFSIGRLNNKTKKCDSSWIELYESDVDIDTETKTPLNRPTSDNTSQITKRELIYSEKFNEKTTFNEQNLTSEKYEIRHNGKFCGKLNNFFSSFYSSKKYIWIKYFNPDLVNLTLNRPVALNDSFEFEINFYEKNSFNVNSFLKHNVIYKSTGNDASELAYTSGNQTQPNLCSYSFDQCTGALKPDRMCLIGSIGYPGIYLKNYNCIYHVRNEPMSAREKLILVNENFQVDANVCYYESLYRGQQATSYFCDAGPRQSLECNDYLNVYDELNDRDRPRTSTMLLKNLCGMGRLPKLVTKKSSLIVELITSSDGSFINSGFLFYAMNLDTYMRRFGQYNHQFDPALVRNEHEYRSLKELERLQIESCDSDTTECVVVINDDIIGRIYGESVDDDDEDMFRIGHLFGINQYHPNSFNLKYVLKTRRFNTIAIYLERYEPTNQAGEPTPLDPCMTNSLSIETSNYDESQTVEHQSDIYYEESYDYPIIEDESRTHENGSNVVRKGKFMTKSDTSNSNKNVLTKICDKNDYNRSEIKYFLIRSSRNEVVASTSDGLKSTPGTTSTKTTTTATTATTTRTDLVINYFTLHQTLSDSSRLFDFKVSYEFLNFDWHTYQEGSLCDFVYDLNENDQLSRTGYLTNPKSSIFYKSTSEKYLSCKYRLVAKQNQYIKLTMFKVDFNLNHQTCENVYVDAKTSNVHLQRCSKLNKKLIVRDLQHSWLGSPLNDIFYSSFDNNDNDNGNHDDDDSYDHDTQRHPDLQTKLCLCKVDKAGRGGELVYISKFDAVEVEFSVKLDHTDPVDTRHYNFLIKYEFVDRNCDKFLFNTKDLNKMATHKGKLMYMPISYGIQMELAKFVNKSKDDLIFYDSLPSYLSNDDRHKRELDNLDWILADNINFRCKFLIRAPVNHFVHIEFSDLSMQQNCDENYIKMFSNFTRSNVTSLDAYFVHKQQRPSPFLRLCLSSNLDATKKPPAPTPPSIPPPSPTQDMADQTQRSGNMIVAEIFDESIANSSFNCYKAMNKICFLTSELRNEFKKFKSSELTMDDVDESGDDFYNSLVLEIHTKKLKRFYFEIKYHYFRILDYEDMIGLATATSAHTTGTLNRTRIVNNRYHKSSRKYKLLSGGGGYHQRAANSCDYKCYVPLGDGGGGHDHGAQNQTHVKICLDESLFCDNEIQCIFNDLDETNCPVKLNSKTILIVLCSTFVFTLSVLLLFYVYRKYLVYFHHVNTHAGRGLPPGGLKKSNSSNVYVKKSVHYSKANQSED